ncbi:storkhead-box protein 2 [Tachyglossus aculeatus]|uniref:storkhead-box protein 2 n=1 Tax=Tachyglossus aculeatus TaxID=9261 RepID=UPI0018F4C7B5|nr:storkhead-box protein 2 [Tachyglossus aculeatus]
MKKTLSGPLRRGWPSSDLSDRASDRLRSRSERDYRTHKPGTSPGLATGPRAYRSKGDVSPISMSPISQSQFIPLGEILCLAISSMNSARKPVTQEALMEHLTTCFPGVPTPSPDILRHTLNMLVRERKVYPTPDGYFVVTPQTHFITPSLLRANSKWYHLDERLPERAGRGPSPQPGPGPAAGPAPGLRERPGPKAHCDACHCCREELHGAHASTLQRRAAKEPAFFGVGGGIPAPPLGPAPDRPKAEAPSKPKDGGGGGGGGLAPEKPSKKFGLKLFRLSFKKDKAKQLANFSAQFPPQEWPLRDEDAPTAIPREVEVEIIRRINPSLTVENIGRHTALMKKLEEEKAQRSRAGSSAPGGARGKRGRSHRKAHGKARSHSKSRLSRGDRSDGSRLDHRPAPGERDSDPGDPRDGGCPPHGPCAPFPATPEWDVSGELAKRRTEVPFPEPSRGSGVHHHHHHHHHQHQHHHHAKVHRSHSHTQDRRSRHERPGRAKERSRSMDNAQGPLGPADPGPDEDGAEAGRRGDPASGPPAGAAPDGPLRPGLARAHGPAAGYPESPGSGGPGEAGGPPEPTRPGPHAKPGLGPAVPAVADDYFQCGAAGEGPAADGAKKPGGPDRPPQRPEGRGGSPGGPPGPGPAPDAFVNGPAGGESGGLDKRKEVFSKDTLFRPPPGPALPLGGYHKPGPPDAPVPARGEKPEPAPAPAPRPAEPAGKPEASFDYYNVSDDDEDEDSEDGGGGGARPPAAEEKGRRGGGGGGVGTMQWLLEREKERDLQRKFEKNLTLLAPKEADGIGQQRATHSARLDSMDSSSITVDSGFNSPRTRESLASNTSSIVESSRRQNPTSLSPVHAASAPAFPFRASPDAPGQAEADKLQKPPSCLQASVTSV